MKSKTISRLPGVASEGRHATVQFFKLASQHCGSPRRRLPRLRIKTVPSAGLPREARSAGLQRRSRSRLLMTSIRRDTLRTDFPNDVSERVSVRIELIDRKCSREAVSLSVQRHVLADIGWAHKNGPGRIPAQRKVIQLVRGLPGLLPNSQAETAGYWRPPGVHDFRPIAMPLGIGRVDHGAVRYSIGPFRHKLHLPHAHNRGIVVVIAGGDRKSCQSVRGRCARAGISFWPVLV